MSASSASDRAYLQVIYIEGPPNSTIELYVGQTIVSPKVAECGREYLKLFIRQLDQGSQTPISPDRVSTLLSLDPDSLAKIKGAVLTTLGGPPQVISEFTVQNPSTITTGLTYLLAIYFEETGENRCTAVLMDAGIAIKDCDRQTAISISNSNR